MRLDALTAGLGAESNGFVGTVKGVFTRAFNIKMSAGKLLSVVAREVGAVPRGFQLETPKGFSFLDHVRAGAGAACRAGLLRIEGSALSIDLRPAKPWRSNLGNISLRRDQAGVAEAWDGAWSVLAMDGGAESFGRQARDAIVALLRATLGADRDEACAAADRLIGLGEGLTPAGDDFLAGFLAGLWSLPAEDAPRRSFCAVLARHIGANANRSSAIGAHYLEAAAEGEVSETLGELAAALGAGDTEKTASAVRAVLAVGASSGAVASYGLLLAVRASEPAIRPAVRLPPDLRPKHDATPQSDR
jgi:hypothetical protein